MLKIFYEHIKYILFLLVNMSNRLICDSVKVSLNDF
jgi:hypothetical protein